MKRLSRRIQSHGFGDRNKRFGRTINTTILLSTGVFGWTFERLCDDVCIGKHRENVKIALHALELQGILQASRARGPGFNIRAMSISDTFPAKAELVALIWAHLDQWPELTRLVEQKMRDTGRKTKVHLKNRGLWPFEDDDDREF